MNVFGRTVLPGHHHIKQQGQFRRPRRAVLQIFADSDGAADRDLGGDPQDDVITTLGAEEAMCKLRTLLVAAGVIGILAFGVRVQRVIVTPDKATQSQKYWRVLVIGQRGSEPLTGNGSWSVTEYNWDGLFGLRGEHHERCTQWTASGALDTGK